MCLLSFLDLNLPFSCHIRNFVNQRVRYESGVISNKVDTILLSVDALPVVSIRIAGKRIVKAIEKECTIKNTN